MGGEHLEVDRRVAITAVPILHPSAVIRGQWAQGPVMVTILKRVKRISIEGTDWLAIPEPDAENVKLYPTLEELNAFISETTGPYTCDIECAGSHLVCVGILDVSTERYVCVRFRNQGGATFEPIWLESRAAWLFSFLNSPDNEKIFHNGQAFDIPYLETIGFTINGFIDDTMLRANCTYAELPKRLEFLASLYCDIVGWKHLIKTGDEDSDK